MSRVRDWARDTQITGFLADGSQGPARHGTHIFQHEQPSQLQILQDLNKTWLLINRLNVKKLECEAGARTHSQ